MVKCASVMDNQTLPSHNPRKLFNVISGPLKRRLDEVPDDDWDTPLIFKESMATLTEEFLAAAAHISLHLDDILPDDTHLIKTYDSIREDTYKVSRSHSA